MSDKIAVLRLVAAFSSAPLAYDTICLVETATWGRYCRPVFIAWRMLIITSAIFFLYFIK